MRARCGAAALSQPSPWRRPRTSTLHWQSVRGSHADHSSSVAPCSAGAMTSLICCRPQPKKMGRTVCSRPWRWATTLRRVPLTPTTSWLVGESYSTTSKPRTTVRLCSRARTTAWSWATRGSVPATVRLVAWNAGATRAAFSRAVTSSRRSRCAR